MQRVPPDSVATWGTFTRRTSDAQDPTFHSRQVAFASRQPRAQEGREAAIAIGAREPGGDAIRIVLIGSPVLPRKTAATERRIDLGERRTPDGNLPAVERPEVHARSKLAAN